MNVKSVKWNVFRAAPFNVHHHRCYCSILNCAYTRILHGCLNDQWLLSCLEAVDRDRSCGDSRCSAQSGCVLFWHGLRDIPGCDSWDPLHLIPFEIHSHIRIDKSSFRDFSIRVLCVVLCCCFTRGWCPLWLTVLRRVVCMASETQPASIFAPVGLIVAVPFVCAMMMLPFSANSSVSEISDFYRAVRIFYMIRHDDVVMGSLLCELFCLWNIWFFIDDDVVVVMGFASLRTYLQNAPLRTVRR